MTMLNEWALQWGVPYAALHDLRQRMGMDGPTVTVVEGESESAVSAQERLQMSKEGGRLWRNNVGAGYMQDGSFIRWGLANDSKQMNERIKSGDLIGIRPVLITPQHVGSTLGQFVSREAKHKGWRYTGTKHEAAQLKWVELITSLGGDARFAAG
jgi:hypothetical protein